MDQLMNSIRRLVDTALEGAAQLTDEAVDTATKAANAATAEFQRLYLENRAKGMTPEDAADAAERAMGVI